MHKITMNYGIAQLMIMQHSDLIMALCMNTVTLKLI